GVVREDETPDANAQVSAIGEPSVHASDDLPRQLVAHEITDGIGADERLVDPVHGGEIHHHTVAILLCLGPGRDHQQTDQHDCRPEHGSLLDGRWPFQIGSIAARWAGCVHACGWACEPCNRACCVRSSPGDFGALRSALLPCSRSPVSDVGSATYLPMPAPGSGIVSRDKSAPRGIRAQTRPSGRPRYLLGGTPNSARNVRMKFDRSSKPTSSAISVTGARLVTRRCAASRRRARRSHWCGVTPVTPLNTRRKWYGLSPAVRARSLNAWRSAVCASRRRSTRAMRPGSPDGGLATRDPFAVPWITAAARSSPISSSESPPALAMRGRAVNGASGRNGGRRSRSKRKRGAPASCARRANTSGSN